MCDEERKSCIDPNCPGRSHKHTEDVYMHMYALNLSVKVPQHCSQTIKGEQTIKMNYGDINLPAVIVLKHGSVTSREYI